MDSTNVGGEDAQPIAQGALASSSQPQNLEQTEQPKKPEQQQQSQSSTQPASNEAALPRRSHIAPRDRFNNQSLGTSLNTAVKQVRYTPIVDDLECFRNVDHQLILGHMRMASWEFGGLFGLDLLIKNDRHVFSWLERAALDASCSKTSS